MTGDDGPKVEEQFALDAVTRFEERLGVPLTATQQEVAIGLMVSGHRFDLVMGVAGSGKTTTLAAVREGFESAGYTVLGTATSGQAARNLGEGAGIESRTVASLSWRLAHKTLELSDRHVLILDEGAMTSDVDLTRLLTAVERSGAKLIIVGDDRQLAIGPRWSAHRPRRTPPRTALGSHRQPAPERPRRSWLIRPVHATSRYWWMRPPRTSHRRSCSALSLPIGPRFTSTLDGGRWLRDQCGQCEL
jgi:hypothetical protein